MSTLVVTLPHVLGQEEALRRLKARQQELETTHRQQLTHLEQEWKDNVLQFQLGVMGVSVRGTITVESSDVVVRLELPLMAMMFKGAIEKQLREEFGRVLFTPSVAETSDQPPG